MLAAGHLNRRTKVRETLLSSAEGLDGSLHLHYWNLLNKSLATGIQTTAREGDLPMGRLMEVLLGLSYATQPNPPIAPLVCSDYVRDTIERYFTSTIGCTGPAICRPFVDIISTCDMQSGLVQPNPENDRSTFTVCTVH